MPWPDSLTIEDRQKLAEERTRKVFNNCLELVRTHENNQIVLYTTALSKQLPSSRAAHAFNNFRECMFKAEIMRLCTLWDKPSSHRESIPSIIALLDNPDVLEWQAHVSLARWIDPAEVPGAFEAQHARDERQELLELISKVKALYSDDLLRRIIWHRDAQVAHSIDPQVRPDMDTAKYGDERQMFDETQTIARKLYLYVLGIDFDWDGMKAQVQRNSRELWENCKFENIPTRL